MPRRHREAVPAAVIQFVGITEQQWWFLRFRSCEESDARAAAAVGVSARTVEGWKKRNPLFRAMHSFATAQPRLFARGELFWRQMTDASRQTRIDAQPKAAGLVRVGTLYARAQADAERQRELRTRALAAQPAAYPAAPVDLDVPKQYRRVEAPPREMGSGERALAEALGVEHAVVLGRWDGRPSLVERPRHEAAVDIVAEFTPGFRIERWPPDAVLFTTAGLVAVADGALSKVAGCPVKRRGRCPFVGRHAGSGGSCSLWDLALRAWLDQEPPSESARSPICDRDFTIARLLAYVAAATMRAYRHNGGWYAGFPIIAVRTAAERAYWEPRVAHWNKLILDPWHRIRIVDGATIVRAIVDFEANEILANERAGTEDRR